MSVRTCQTETLVVLSVLLVTQVLLRSECELTQHLSWEHDGILFLFIELLGVSRLVRRVGLPWALDVPCGVSNCSFVATTTSECLADQVCFVFPSTSVLCVFRFVCVVS